MVFWVETNFNSCAIIALNDMRHESIDRKFPKRNSAHLDTPGLAIRSLRIGQPVWEFATSYAIQLGKYALYLIQKPVQTKVGADVPKEMRGRPQAAALAVARGSGHRGSPVNLDARGCPVSCTNAWIKDPFPPLSLDLNLQVRLCTDVIVLKIWV